MKLPEDLPTAQLGNLSLERKDSELEVILGAIQFGQFPNLSGRPAPFPTASSIVPIFDLFKAHGHSKIDTARIYGGGLSESLLAEAEYEKRGFKVETKLYPTKSRPLGPQNVPYSFDAEGLRAGLMTSLEALKTGKIDTWYLYAPDRTVPYEDTLREINKLHQEGYFERWGMCNFPAWEVAIMQEICIRNGWVRPAVFQGVYNALLRSMEAELIPCLRHYGMSFEAAQPLASGLLSSRYRRDMPDSEHEPGRRFDPSHFLGRHVRERYWHGAYFDALEIISKSAKEHDLTVVECVLRWLSHHSVLKRELGDAVVICGSDVAQFEELLEGLEKGPLPEGLVTAMEEAWGKSKCKPWQYHN